jgi:hypothetical protein
MAKRNKRAWHPNFIKYMQFIVNHENYQGMPEPYKQDGSIRWVISGKSEIGKKRLIWWDKKRAKIGIKKEGAWISKVARAIHPIGLKPCQICGKKMSLDYIYPNKRGTKSPGAMSNAPDRFDGYHTYNLCCRSVQDTGRHKSNLNRYGEDRRVYENWSDGDWKAASWLMKIFNRHGLSPDHIGPLSLGFAHRPKFNPLTRAQNSAKNNRMSFSDIKLLLDDEKKGEIVVSGHSKYIWDKLKSSIKNDQDALKLSKLMRLHLHQILTILSEIHKRGYKAFLVRYFLHPEYANYSIEFLGFDPSNGSYKEMIKKIGTKKQYSNNAKRYIRKSFDVLKKYRIVKKRNTKIITSSEIKSSMEAFFQLLKAGKEKEARKKLDLVFSIIGDKLTKNFR